MRGGGGGAGPAFGPAPFLLGGVGAAKGLLPCFLVPKRNQPTACTLALWWLKFGPTEGGGGGGVWVAQGGGGGGGVKTGDLAETSGVACARCIFVTDTLEARRQHSKSNAHRDHVYLKTLAQGNSGQMGSSPRRWGGGGGARHTIQRVLFRGGARPVSVGVPLGHCPHTVPWGLCIPRSIAQWQTVP